MANPTRPKDAKPKADGDEFEIKQTTKVETNSSGISLIAVIAIVVAAVAVITLTNYFFIDSKMSEISKKMSEISFSGDDEVSQDDEESTKAERGIILDLGEFILNLSDVTTRKFLKVNVAIELSKKDSDFAEQPKASGGGHGHGAPAVVDPMVEIEKEMNQYKPAIRDSVISILSSKTSEEVATTPGKELAKEQIKESINAIFDGEREVLRVSFGSFFIQ